MTDMGAKTPCHVVDVKRMPGDGSPFFLFRYRDLVADTLAEHRKIVTKHGYCWWGWWKRPNEPAREEVWSELKRRTDTGESVRVALFDSGSGAVHWATVEAVLPPESDEYGSLRAVTPDKAELSKVPAYYRASPHSRAWMRLKSIASEPLVNFFGSYSYFGPPPLSHYPASQLAKFENKRIVDAEELRSMDATIWVVRLAKPGDTSENVLLPLPGVDSPVLSQPVSCVGEWILHITDPHYGLGRFRSEHRWRLDSEDKPGVTMVDAIATALLKGQRPVGAVLVTGDLTFVGSDEEFTEARSSLFKLVTGELGLSLDRLMVIPGNHDIVWTRQDGYQYGAPVDLAPPEATENYRKFFKELYRYEADQNLSMARRFIFPGGRVIDIIGLNSSSLEQGKSFLSGMGRVQEAAFDHAMNALRWDDHKGGALRILALHHHVALTDDLESPDEFAKGFGIAVDAPRTLRKAAANGVHLVVHGHKHRAFVWRAGAYELPEHTRETWELGHVNIVGGGSSGSTATDGPRNYFNLIRMKDSTVELEMWRSENSGSFERFMTWRAVLAPSYNGGPLEIQPWNKVHSE
jgi:hypothetical protein